MLIVKEGTNGFDGTDEATRKLITDAFEKEGLTVRNPDQDKSYIAANSQKAIDEAFRTRNQQLEDTVKELTGVDKANATEKYYDYFKRAITSKLTDLAGLQAKVKEYEEKGTNGNALAEEYKKQVVALQGQIKDAKAEYDKQLSDKDSAIFKSRLDSIKADAVSKLKTQFKGEIADNLIDDIVSARVAQFDRLYKPKEVGGVIILHDDKDEPVMNKKDAKPYSIEEKMAEVFAPYLDEKKVQSGAGSSKNAAPKPEDKSQPTPWKDSKMPETVTSRPALTKWLQNDLKLNPSSKEFTDAFNHFAKKPDGSELPLREVALTA